jgi:hypothetical protein
MVFGEQIDGPEILWNEKRDMTSPTLKVKYGFQFKKSQYRKKSCYKSLNRHLEKGYYGSTLFSSGNGQHTC